MTFSDIRAAIDGRIRPLKGEIIPLLAAYGRVSAGSISSRRNMPPFDVSALDGYGVRGEGTRFELIGDLSPFVPVPARLKGGEAFFVPTGGRIPQGSRFVMREHVTEEGRRIRVETGADERRVVKKGDWLRRGSRVVDKGGLFTPSTMALAALAGIRKVPVYARPAVAVITTGSELKKGRMVNSNAFLLAGLIQRDGGQVLGLYTADDEEEEIRALVERLGAADLLVLTGGTSQGKKDLTRQAIRRSGGRILLDAPPVMPGRTMAFGRKGTTPFFILPGNPRAIRTLYEVFVKRGLLTMAGRMPAERSHRLPLPGDVKKPADMIAVVPVLLRHGQAAIAELHPSEPNGFIVLEQEPEHLSAGAMVRVLET
jgi:molybdopterin molybdotransferase